MNKVLISGAFATLLTGAIACGPADFSKTKADILTIGQSQTHPNSIVVEFENLPSRTEITWIQDGEQQGRVFKSGSRYIITPSQYADNVRISLKGRGNTSRVYDIDLENIVDVQAHRGGMGLYPEESVAAMKNSVDLGVNTLEMDLVVSKDGKVILSHDKFFHHRYATRPDGTPVNPGDPKEYIYSMPYDSVAKYDVGLKYNSGWPEKVCMPAVKPLAADVLAFIEDYTVRNNLSPVRYNIEIKSDPDYDGGVEGRDWPYYKDFVDYCVGMLKSFDLGDRLTIQSFDERALNYIHEKYPEFILSYLLEGYETDLDKAMSLINFTPKWISPEHQNVTEEFMKKSKSMGMKVVTWTVDDPQEMRRLISLGVDGIISNYPDRLLAVVRGTDEK